ncbi:response regulator [Rhodoferax sp.]|uniref:response regulator n=1 Tax=Rhodoferax sp. TaxID=50421 RepID=UPI002624C4F8|nr:response regulator [Rhodoferax sp.]MDD4942201.1 response regulator [Rhodoferax sp.]MDD5480638.1 response regulator [Rhodoferax sp.]
MALPEDDLSSSQALVIDPNPTSRSILVSQLRDFGVANVVQTARLVDARRQLEYRKFDVVLCEQHFPLEAMTGQDLLDDLRRNQLLPFFTVFIMVTGEATYAKVAEAAESALDGYLLKPHRASQLGDRLRQARVRKLSLQPIFSAIEADDFATAATLCLERFESRGKFWLYAARVGAELMLRTGQTDQAQKLYQAVVQAKTLPWAKLGVARSLLDEGQTAKAVSTLENLISEDPTYTDAYDVMGRAQFEQGKFDAALATYQMASTLTPASITRMQNLGLMSYYCGDHAKAEKILDRTTRMGLDSKMFDCQTLVLLAFIRLELADRKGLQRCRDDFLRLIERQPDSARHQRLYGFVAALQLIEQSQYAQVLDVVRTLCSHAHDPEFDFESASNLLALLAQLADKAIQLDEVDPVVDALALRFAGTRALSELLAGAAALYPPYPERIRAAHARILKLAENAMSMSLKGNPGAAVQDLLTHGTSTLSGKLIETAYLVLHRYSDKIDNAPALTEQVHDLRTRYSTHITRASLGEPKRQAGGLILRTGGQTAKAAG